MLYSFSSSKPRNGQEVYSSTESLMLDGCVLPNPFFAIPDLCDPRRIRDISDCGYKQLCQAVQVLAVFVGQANEPSLYGRVIPSAIKWNRERLATLRTRRFLRQSLSRFLVAALGVKGAGCTPRELELGGAA